MDPMWGKMRSSLGSGAGGTIASVVCLALMLALVVGATGYTGGHVVSVLREREIETVAHVRPTSRGLTAARQRFEASGARVDTSAWEPETINGMLERTKPSIVFSLLGTTRARAARDGVKGDIYEAVDGRLTRMLADATRAAVPDARFVLLSSIGTNPKAKNAYLKSRAEMENYCVQSGLRVTIARAPFITGPDRKESRPAERIGAAVADAALSASVLLGGIALKRRYSSMSGRQLAEALVHAALDPSCGGVTLEPQQLRKLAHKS